MTENVFRCSLCDYNTNKKFNLNRHINKKHEQDKNEEIIKICSKCGKELSTKTTLKNHLNICKGILNPLECHICHKIFNNRSSKCYHLKKCCFSHINNENYSSSNVEIKPITIINNSNIIQLNQTFNIIYNNNTVINLIYYDKQEAKINFDISHFNKENMYILFKNFHDDAFNYLSDKLFENKKNQLIIKNKI